MTEPVHARAIIFDLDGTLVDSLPGIEFSVDCSLLDCGLPRRTRELRPLVGPPIRAIFSQLSPESDERSLSRLEQSFRSSYDSTGLSKTVLADSALGTLRALCQSGVPLFVATNKPSAPTRQILQLLGIGELFVDVICRDSRTPPFLSKAEMLRHLLYVHQLEAKSCLYVGDTCEDYRAAGEMAMPVAIVSYGYGEPGACYPQAIGLNSLSELLTKLEVMEMS